MSTTICITATERLLPSFQKIEHQKAIQLSTMITIIAKQAISIFLQVHTFGFDNPKKVSLREFDGLGGDNSCKIRAAKVAEIFQRSQNSDEFLKKIKNLLKKICDIENKLSKINPSKNNLSLKDFRIKHEIEFSMDPDVEFLIATHFLFLAKKENSHYQTDPQLLMDIAKPTISKSTAKKWMHTMQKSLAHLSVQFIQQQVEKVKNNRKEILRKMVHTPFIRTYEKRPVLPNFHCMEILLTCFLQEGGYILLKIDEPDKSISHILCKPNKIKTTFVPIDIQEQDLDMPAIVIEATRLKKTSKEFFLKNDLFQLLLTTAAQDPQYLNRRIEDIPFEKSLNDTSIQVEKSRLGKFIILADTMGVSSKNPEHFLIGHMFCDLVGAVSKKTE